MKQIDKEFILKLIDKEIKVHTLALRNILQQNLDKALENYRIHIHYELNKTLLNLE